MLIENMSGNLIENSRKIDWELSEKRKTAQNTSRKPPLNSRSLLVNDPELV